VKDEVGDLLIDFILDQVGSEKSPIKGESFPKLDPKYREIKKKAGRGTKANLEFSGDMLDALEKKRTADGVKLQIKGTQAPKADGHNNFSGKSRITTRQFLPKEGDKFKPSAKKEIDRIIQEAVVAGQKIKKSAIRNITSKTELNMFLTTMFPDLSSKEAQRAIILNEELRELFGEFNLIELFDV